MQTSTVGKLLLRGNLTCLALDRNEFMPQLLPLGISGGMAPSQEQQLWEAEQGGVCWGAPAPPPPVPSRAGHMLGSPGLGAESWHTERVPGALCQRSRWPRCRGCGEQTPGLVERCLCQARLRV